VIRRTYVETFDDGCGGWLGWLAGGGGPLPLETADSAAIVRSPWGVDYNHAPPGAGYLHLLYVLFMRPSKTQAVGGPNRFLDAGFSRDFTNARFSVRVRGDVDLKGANLLLLVQADTAAAVANFVLTGQPIALGPQWSWTTLELRPDPAQWLCLGTRGAGAHDRRYGYAPVADVLRDVNVDIILVLFPLDVRPAAAIAGDPHRLRAGKDYPIDLSRLPSGCVMLDEVRVEYP
jgi:hypothetical protein